MRGQAAWLATQLLNRYKDKYPDLLPRITHTLLDALRDGRKPLSTHYGAIVGLRMLGPLVVHCLLMPALPGYLDQLRLPLALGRAEAAAASSAADAAAAGSSGGGSGSSSTAAAPAANGGGLSSKQRRAAPTEAALRQADALRVHGALLHVCGRYFFRHAPLFSSDPPPSAAPPEPAAANGAPLSGAAAASAAAAAARNAAALKRAANGDVADGEVP